ncbi:uncharacterized protein LOC118435086 isoform X2 [Folsomia candida]|uniref:uncharacterized protein LOC118435086 isoform X2 n=1 Tax=Folsomia candida TaxID=158441 RepID=UPI00160501D1|nr:uncharacterized protein LOC118435086 isoform X2 [Folsomia candida]
MGSLSFLLVVVMGMVVVALGSPLSRYGEVEEDGSLGEDGYYNDGPEVISPQSEEEPARRPPRPSRPLPLKTVRRSEPTLSPHQEEEKFQQCQMNLLWHLQEACTDPKYTQLRVMIRHRMARMQLISAKNGGDGGASSQNPFPSWPRSENVVDACCKKQCGIEQLLMFCPTSVTTTMAPTTPPPTTTTPPTSPTPPPSPPEQLEQQERHHPLQHQDGRIFGAGRNHHRNPLAQREEWQVDIIVRPEQQDRYPSGDGSNVKPKFGTPSYARGGSGAEQPESRRHRPTNLFVVDETPVADERVSFEIGTGGGTRDDLKY